MIGLLKIFEIRKMGRVFLRLQKHTNEKSSLVINFSQKYKFSSSPPPPHPTPTIRNAIFTLPLESFDPERCPLSCLRTEAQPCWIDLEDFRHSSSCYYKNLQTRTLCKRYKENWSQIGNIATVIKERRPRY